MPSSASVALDEFLKRHKLSQTAAAGALGVEKAAVCAWLAGRTKPRHEYRKAIARWTGGEIPVDSWLDAEDIALIESVVPFAPAPVPTTEAAA